MIVVAAVCPHPPLIVPELAGAAAPELDGLRSACQEAIDELLGADPDVIVVVGGAEKSQPFPVGAAGTMRPWGVDVRFGLGDPVLPLSLTIGRLLLGDHGDDAQFEAIAFDATPEECAQFGERLAGSAARTGLLVMGDGSARLTDKAPGYLHPGAAAYNAELARALAGDADSRVLNPALAEEMWCGGRAAFQVLAAARSADARQPCAPTGDRTRVLYEDAPYGVGYFVTVWAPARA